MKQKCSAIRILFIITVLSNEKLATSADNARSSVSDSYKQSIVVNDNICNNNEKSVAYDVIMLDNVAATNDEGKIVKRETSDHDDDFKDRPRADQKSLVMVFDATGSMHDDLEQLRSGAREIINEMSARTDNPVFNYILVVFRDPDVEAPFDTRNSDDLLAKLQSIKIHGGGDCPEMSLTGLRIALDLALPNSLAYVFSDATAKDYKYYEQVLELIQKKQITVNFLLTGDCQNPDSNEYRVYHHLSSASNGQVYDMGKSNVKDVLLAIRHTVNHNYASLKSLDSQTAGLTNTKLNVDKTISELSVSLTGRNPSLTIKDPRNETVKGEEDLSLSNLRLVRIKDPLGGLWNVEARADSSHSVRLGAISDIKFQFGFSVEEPKKISETSYQPLKGVKNILSIFVDDSSLISNLTDVVITIPKNNFEASTQFKIPVKAASDGIFTTKPFDVPKQMFNVQLNGFDATGNVVERLISTGVQSKHGSSPDVRMEVNKAVLKENEKFLVRCSVKSLTFVNISIGFNGSILKTRASSQSNEIDFEIANVAQSNSGNYSCVAVNEHGENIQAIWVSVKTPPRIRISSNEIIAVEGSEVSIQCEVEDASVKFPMKWLNNFGEILTNDSSNTYNFVAYRELNSQSLYCEFQDPDFPPINNSALITVEYRPYFESENIEEEIEAVHGSKIDLNCKVDANPNAYFNWSFANSIKHEILPFQGDVFSIDEINQEHRGVYECRASNKLGRVKRSFDVDVMPKGRPTFDATNELIYANLSDTVEFSCRVFNSLPIENFNWTIEKSDDVQFTSSFDIKKDISTLYVTIKNVQKDEEFECIAENEFGRESKKFKLVVQTPAEIKFIDMLFDADIVQNRMQDDGDNVEVVEGETFSFKCETLGFPRPSIMWHFNGEKIDFDTEQELLVLHSISEKDEGAYTCTTENIIGNSSKNFTLDVLRPPKIRNNGVSSLKVFEGDEVSFECEFDGKPKPKISWRSNLNEIIGNSDEKFQDERHLNFTGRLTDSGIYSCVVANEYGTDSKNFTLIVLAIPKFLESTDESLKVNFSDDISIPCDASGFPQPEISWHLNNQIISKDSILLLHSVEESNVYICNAQNEAGIAQKIFYVNVVSQPHILSEFEDIDIFTNQSKTLDCIADGIPSPTVRWSVDEVVVSNDGTLILNSSVSSGRYHCVAENLAGKSESSVDVRIINKPKLLANYRDIKTQIKLREGDQIELICPFENFNSIHWSLNDVSHLGKAAGENRLKLEKLSESESGIWKCEVVNSAGNEFFSFNVSVSTSPMVRASWNLNHGMSEFLFTESDIDERYFKVGETLKLSCSAKGSPKPKIIWKKSTDVIAEGETLVIENLEFHHSDIYTCSAQNENGIVKKFFKIDVISPPYIENDVDIEKHFQKNVGDSIIFRCRITGNPQPSVFWFKDNTLLDETDTFYEIERIQIEDGGVYKCIGKNSWGRESIEFQLNIMEGAKILETKVIEEKKISKNAESIRLSCSVRGNPTPIISWLSNGHILSTTSKLNFEKLLSTTHESSMLFTGHGHSITQLDPFRIRTMKEKFYSQLSKLDDKTLKLDIIFTEKNERMSGNYKCYVYNALGRSERSVDVEILKEPTINENEVLDFSREIELLENLPLIIACPISGKPAPSISWYKNNRQIYENDTVKFMNSNRHLSIAEAFSWHSGNYSCKGANKLGEKSIEFHVNVLAPPKFIDVAMLSPLSTKKFFNDKVISHQKFHDRNIMKVMQGDDVTLECFADGYPQPQVHWVRVDYTDRTRNEILDESENILVVDDVQASSMLMCYVNNTMGNIKKVFEIDVQSGPKFVDPQTEQKIDVKLHHGQNFDCKVTGNPEPTVKWILNDKVIFSENKDFYLTSDNQIVRLIESKKSNQGKLLCRAENDYGKIEKVFYVNVEVPIQWSDFGAWSECSKSCGMGGIQLRTRVCLLALNGLPALVDEQKCVGEKVEMRTCNQLACPINGGWGDWSEWSKCPDCVDGIIETLPVTTNRTRKCDNPRPSNGGLECFGDSVDEVECLKVKFCPVDGGWSSWTQWSACSKTCGVGVRVRKRSCSKPEPKFNGVSCDGENVEYEECRVVPCYGNSMRKSFEPDNDEYVEDYFSDSQDRFKEIAELEIEDEHGVTRNYQLTQHREVEYVSPPHDGNHMRNGHDSSDLPKVKITLNTYKTISAETYNNFAKAINSDRNEDISSQSSFENLDFDSSEDDEKVENAQNQNCILGFLYNSINRQCEDINECKTNHFACKSNELCVNTIGSFKCEPSKRRT